MDIDAAADARIDGISIGAGPERGADARLAFLSTMPPTRCGLASFAGDLVRAVRLASPRIACHEVAVEGGDPPECRDGRRGVRIARDRAEEYDAAARTLDAIGVDALCVQHEFGIYGGPDGEMLLRLLDRLRAPVVTTLHTVLDDPGPNQRRVLEAIARRSSRIVVMTRRSAEIARDRYDIPRDRIAVVPHGIPPSDAADAAAGRRALGAEGRTLLLTFGLLSPGKGIEHAIRAMPAIRARVPDVLYVVLGATHPNLVLREGERYRLGLRRLVGELGLEDQVRFLDRYVEPFELTDALAAADLYLTPYLNEAQSVSGTLAYSFGIGNAIVSTPYRHAVELLRDGGGVLVPFGDAAAIAAAVGDLLADPERLRRIRARNHRAGREMVWPRIGERYLAILRDAVAEPRVRG